MAREIEIEIERKHYLLAELWADEFYGESFTRNDALLARLVESCRADMAGSEAEPVLATGTTTA